MNYLTKTIACISEYLSPKKKPEIVKVFTRISGRVITTSITRSCNSAVYQEELEHYRRECKSIRDMNDPDFISKEIANTLAL